MQPPTNGPCRLERRRWIAAASTWPIRWRPAFDLALGLLTAGFVAPFALEAASSQLLGWNNLGMHCMDSDYSVFSILPPYNTIEAQLIVGSKLVTNGAGYTVTYQAVADPTGSFNSTARGKGNFYDYVLPLYGVALSPELGLTRSWPMPGTNNTPQGMLFEQTNHPAPGVATVVNWFRAEGIPITPTDDAGRKNPYPMMRLIARSAGGTPIATNDIVLPVSDEMDCRACHASGTAPTAAPVIGWVWSSNPERDYRLNILRLHDQQQFAGHAGLYESALAARGFNRQGLYRNVVADGKPVLCATCHASEALGTGSYGTIPPLTASVHTFHAHVVDPVLNVTLDNSRNRAACYRCHPGSTTRCLRGAMGSAVAADGSGAMQCQDCHGTMSAVGASSRVGWFMEPNCQSCHTGTATSNNGQIRYPSCFEADGPVRVPVNQTFATTPDTPAPGLSLFRFSRGHGGLQCEACHGSTHAEFPAIHGNDNIRNENIQGHAGMMIECTACHVAMTASTSTALAGPHGLHPIGQTMVNGHPDLLEDGVVTRSQCRACHGANDRGTVLSRAQGARTLATKFGTETYWRGQQVSCYDCHDGADSDDPSRNSPPVVSNVSATVLSGASATVTLPGSDANGQTLGFRVVAQPVHGTVGLIGAIATYFAEPGYVGTEAFTFAANDGLSDSNLGTGTVAVAQGPFSVAGGAHVPPSWPAGWPTPFSAMAAASNITAVVAYDWDFGDGSGHATEPHLTHAYSTPGIYWWTLVARVSTSQATFTGSIWVADPMLLSIAPVADSLTVAWPKTAADVVLEQAPILPTPAWTPDTHEVMGDLWTYRVTIPNPGGNGFLRLRLVQ